MVVEGRGVLVETFNSGMGTGRYPTNQVRNNCDKKREVPIGLHFRSKKDRFLDKSSKTIDVLKVFFEQK